MSTAIIVPGIEISNSILTGRTVTIVDATPPGILIDVGVGFKPVTMVDPQAIEVALTTSPVIPPPTSPDITSPPVTNATDILYQLQMNGTDLTLKGSDGSISSVAISASLIAPVVAAEVIADTAIMDGGNF